VIAYGAGGALETVRDIRQHPDSGTGLFFQPQSADALIEAVNTFERSKDSFSPERGRLNAAGFAPKIFGDRYLAFLEHCKQDYKSRCSPEKFKFPPAYSP
jgi:glycogen synthase